MKKRREKERKKERRRKKATRDRHFYERTTEARHTKNKDR